MTQRVIRERELLLFYHILLPLCDTPPSRIQEDKRLPYYSEVEKGSNIHAFHIGIGGSYGHRLKLVKFPGIIFCGGCIVRDGFRGETSGAIYCRVQMGAEYDDDITKGMNY